MTDRSREALLLTTDFPPLRGGIQLLLDELVCGLQQVVPRVVTFGGPGAREVDAARPIVVHRVPHVAKTHRGSVAALNALAVAIGLRTRPGVVISGHVVMTPAAATLRRALGCRVVQYVYANEFSVRPGLTARAVQAADATIAISRYGVDLALTAGAQPHRVHLIHPGVRVPRATGRQREARPTIVSVARLAEPFKGHDVVLAGLPAIRARIPDVHWVVIGDGPLLPRLRAAAYDAGLDGAVTFTGSLRDAERNAWLDRGQVFCLPSRPRADGGGGEGFGIVFLEAGVHGLPVVAGNVGGAVDAIEDGVTGLLVDPTDPGAVADAVIELLADPDRAREMGEAGRRRAREFTWDAMVERTEPLLLEAIYDR